PASSSRSWAAARCWSTYICSEPVIESPPLGGRAGGVSEFPGEVVEVREEVRPAGPFRLTRRGGMDGVLRHRGGVLERLLHDGERPVVVRVAQTAHDRVLFGASAHSRAAAAHGIARMRFALGVDEDLRAFRRRFL